MEPLIISEYQADSYILKLQTCERNDIDNEQCFTLSKFEVSQATSFETDYVLATFKSEMTPIYNCHGFTFASKRTGIYSDSEIEKILNDDKYIEIKTEKDVLPGDVIIYYNESGISH